MSDLKQAAQQALEALENGKRVRNFEGGTKYQPTLEDNAITALRTALAREHALHDLARLGQEIEQQAEPWCMKANGCKTRCGNCPNFPSAQQQAEPVASVTRNRNERTFFDKVLYDGSNKPQQQAEPVAWMDKHGNIDHGLDAILEPEGWVPLYTTPPQRQWVGLTDEEIKAAWSQLWCDINKMKLAPDDRPQKETVGFIFAKAIEAKLKERNHDR